MRSQRPLDVDYIQALEDRDTRKEFIHRALFHKQLVVPLI